MSERLIPSVGRDSRETINRAIRVPEKLVTDDGRRLLVRSWMPIIKSQSAVSVTVEAIIEIEVGDE